MLADWLGAFTGPPAVVGVAPRGQRDVIGFFSQCGFLIDCLASPCLRFSDCISFFLFYGIFGAIPIFLAFGWLFRHIILVIDLSELSRAIWHYKPFSNVFISTYVGTEVDLNELKLLIGTGMHQFGCVGDCCDKGDGGELEHLVI